MKTAFSFRLIALLFLVAPVSETTSAPPPTRTDVSIAYTCPTAGSFAGCMAASEMYAVSDAYVVTSVSGIPSSETARLNGRVIRHAASSRIVKGGRITGQWRWWPVSHEKGSFAYVAVSANGATRTTTVNLR